MVKEINPLMSRKFWGKVVHFFSPPQVQRVSKFGRRDYLEQKCTNSKTKDVKES